MPNKQPLTTKPASLPGVITAFFGHDCLKWDIHLPMDTLPMSPLPTKNISWDTPHWNPLHWNPLHWRVCFPFFQNPRTLGTTAPVSYTHLRAHETGRNLV